MIAETLRWKNTYAHRIAAQRIQSNSIDSHTDKSEYLLPFREERK